ncbi:MAG: CopG family transcriptional regulator [Chloroflexota bacterium]
MSETEKITINLGVVDLGKIDLLVEQGFYTTRTDFIRAGIRSQLLSHHAEIQETVTRRAIVVGVLHYSASALEKIIARGEQVEIIAAGMLVLSDDISPALALAAIKSIQVFGVFKSSKEVKQALADRITD